MQKIRILFGLGIFLSILPYLGFPYGIKNFLITLSSLGIIFLTYLLYNQNKRENTVEKKVFENFSENNDFVENSSEDK